MYYEEALIDGVPMCRYSTSGEWTPMPAAHLWSQYQSELREKGKVIGQLEECRDKLSQLRAIIEDVEAVA